MVVEERGVERHRERDSFQEDGLMGVYALLQTVQGELRLQGNSNVQMRQMVEENQKTVDRLSQIIREGDGGRSLMLRVELIEQSMLRMSEMMLEIRQSLQLARSEDTKGRWSLANSVVTGILAVIAAILTALLSQLMGRRP